MTKSLLAVLALGVAGCGPTPGDGSATGEGVADTPAAVASAAHELGRKIYNFRCYYCHGYSGDAHTLAATYLDPPPRDFTSAKPEQLSRERVLDAVTNGRAGTAMKGFVGIITEKEIATVADFVRNEFLLARRENTRYHTAENGWAGHERYSAAFPFARGDIPLDKRWEELSAEEQTGKRLFMSSCVSCHDRAKVAQPGAIWDSRPLSYPRAGYSPANLPDVDAVSSASPYLLHDKPPQIAHLSSLERRGEMLYQQNCAFCHAADGTGKNWIGSFMEPHPRDLTSKDAMAAMSRTRLTKVIREGLQGTSMPAWKSVLKPEEIQAIIAYVSRAFHPIAES